MNSHFPNHRAVCVLQENKKFKAVNRWCDLTPAHHVGPKLRSWDHKHNSVEQATHLSYKTHSQEPGTPLISSQHSLRPSPANYYLLSIALPATDSPTDSSSATQSWGLELSEPNYPSFYHWAKKQE